MNSVFNEQILVDKLSKLNNTQQCIEKLSHWCIFHQSKAEQVVATWDKQFHNSEMALKVPLLNLANDILQNSKRKGNEFVSEFWKVLPAALKDVLEKGDERGKNVVSRLVDIWEQRRVFGSRAKSLKDVMLGEEMPPPLEFNKKRSRSVRIMKRDSRSIKTKLSIGGTAEKIVSAFHLVLSEHPNEEAEMSKCKTAIHNLRKMGKDVVNACSVAKDPKRKTLAKELEEEENILKQRIIKLKSVEASRLALVTQLKEALHEQESELENVRTQVQVAQTQVEEATNMRKQLNDEDFVSKASTATSLSVEENAMSEQKTKSAAAIAAEVADKLAASTSSQMIMSSVLSTFAAEEAKSARLANVSTPSSSLPSNNASTTSISNHDKFMVGSDASVFTSTKQLIGTPRHSYPSVLVPQPTITNQAPASQAQYHLLAKPSSQQYMQPKGGVISPHGYSGNIPQLTQHQAPTPSPPPPRPQLQSHMISPMVPLSQPPLQITQQHPVPLAPPSAQITQHQDMPMPQQAPAPPSFRPLQPPGMVYYSNLHHSY